jgi:hypothetical protein
VASCANCGSNLAKKARYCPQCGQPTSAGDTKVIDVPPAEIGRVPVEYVNAEPHYYGVTPTTLVLVLAGVAFTVAVVLFALGRWPFGLIAVGGGVLLVLIFIEAARRKPDGVVARSTTDALDGFRARAGLAADSLATRGRAARRVLALRRELRRMSGLRDRLLFELGDAVYRGDDVATERARGQVRELDELAAQREAEMQGTLAQAQDRLRRRRLEVQPTEMVELPDRPGQGGPSGPAVIPEPGPLAPEERPQEGRLRA